MFNFLKNNPAKTTTVPSVAPVSTPPSKNPQHSNVRRELIQVVLKDTLRLHGIPSSWMTCEVIINSRSPGDEELHIQLVVMKWKEQLMRYAPALQQQLLLGLDRFDPSVDHSKYIVSWRFSPDCGYPFTRMPDPKFWPDGALTQLDDEPVPVLDRRHTRRPPNAPRPNPAVPEAPNPPPDFSAARVTPLR